MEKEVLDDTKKGYWNIEITPKDHLLTIDWKEIWRYRDLFVQYVKRDIITVYKQTILGPLWFFISPIFTTIMYMFVFNTLAGNGGDATATSWLSCWTQA